MLKVRSLFPENNLHYRSIGVDNISRDVAYELLENKFNVYKNAKKNVMKGYNQFYNKSNAKQNIYPIKKYNKINNNKSNVSSMSNSLDNSVNVVSNDNYCHMANGINLHVEKESDSSNQNHISTSTQNQHQFSKTSSFVRSDNDQKKLTIPNICKPRRSQIKRKSLLQSYDFIFQQQKQKQKQKNMKKYQMNIMGNAKNIINQNIFMKQTGKYDVKINSISKFSHRLQNNHNKILNQTKFVLRSSPKVLLPLSQLYNNDYSSSRISGSLNLSNSCSSFLKKLDLDIDLSNFKNLNRFNNTESIFRKDKNGNIQKVKTFDVNRRLKRLKKGIQIDRLLQSSNLMKIYNQLYESYEAVPFDENQEIFKRIQDEVEEKFVDLQEQEKQKKQKTQKSFKAYDMVVGEGKTTLKNQLKQLTKDTEQILGLEAKDSRDFVRNGN